MPNGFQSTPPARGATTGFSRDKWLTLISIHAPREGGDPLGRYTTSTPQRNFNPRPPRGGRRWTETGGCTISGFQSTPPARGATGLDICALHAALISIHAPREGGDFTALSTNFVFLHFNPRPPRGGRRPTRSARSRFLPHFNPRPPRGGRRLRCLRDKLCKPLFQSTPPARGATSWRTIGNGELSHFNPRPPRGGRPYDLP